MKLRSIPSTPEDFWEKLETLRNTHGRWEPSDLWLTSDLVGRYITDQRFHRGKHFTIRLKVVGFNQDHYDQIVLHKVLKNGKLSKARDARWFVEIDWFLGTYRPSPLKQLAMEAE